MKYLYLILRLFFCPHKYKLINTIDVWGNPNAKYPKSVKMVYECTKCGKVGVTDV
jgi:hypothetical protein